MADTVRQIGELKQQGMTYRQIAPVVGLAPNTVRNYANDPDGAKARARKASYGRPCEGCGKTTDGSNGRALAPRLCASCHTAAQHENRHWTPERVIAALQHYARVHGRAPFSSEWLYADVRYDRMQTDGYEYPVPGIVQREFGSWLNAIEAAGLEPPDYFTKRKSDEYHFSRVLEASEDGGAPRYRDVESTRKVLVERGYTWDGVLRKLGLQPRARPFSTTEEVLERLRAVIEDGKMPRKADHVALHGALRVRGITWTEAADLVGAKPLLRRARSK
jgi:hypothetical protein